MRSSEEAGGNHEGLREARSPEGCGEVGHDPKVLEESGSDPEGLK